MRGHRAAAMAALLLLGGCAGDQPGGGALAAWPGAEEQILRRYEGNAMESDGRCGETKIAVITGSKVVREDAAGITFAVTYRFEQEGLNAGTLECSGFATRSFSFLKAPDGLALASMGGMQHGE